MSWLIWAVVLLLQNASFTWVSRARNSGNIKYHAIAAVGSNGIWFVTQFIVVGIIARAIASHDYGLAVRAGLWYTLWTVIGSVFMHWFLMKHIEKGSRKVGA